MVVATKAKVLTPEELQQAIDKRIVMLQDLLWQGGCRCCVSYERNEYIIDVSFEYFGAAQAIIRKNRICCVVRPF